ncbi:MAG: mandelate racemase/muconate lactonizing enzyme family protein [Actinobacteria bacterium]|nr:mandelate racemase/muconate lactonizing enzyme family protein [Actinomycetota bacterium]
MRITGIETFTVGAGWKNWLIVRVHTDGGVSGIGEGTLNGFVRTIEAAVRELEHLAIGEDPRRVTALAHRLHEAVSNEGGHIHRHAIAALEVACWDILGKSLGVPIHELLGGRVRDSVSAYANGWYRTERDPGAFVAAAEPVVELGFHALKLDPFGTAHGFLDDAELALALEIARALRERWPELAILIDVHARFAVAESVRVARAFEPLGIFWWEEPTSRDPDRSPDVARGTSLRVATGETFHTAGQFFELARAGGVSIWQPEPMSLGGIGATYGVARLAEASGAWLAPHQSGGPVATAVCLQLAACVPNFLVQEHFDPFNEAWTAELVTWRPELDAGSGRLSLPTAPGLGLDLVDEVARAHPYDPHAYLDVHAEGWEQRLGHRGAARA